MLHRSPRTVALWAAAVLVAIVTAVMVITTLSSLRHQDETFGRLHPVVVARRDLPLGTRIDAADLTNRRVRGDDLAPDALREPREAIDRIVRTPLLRDSAVTRRHLTAGRRGSLGEVLPPDRRAYRLVIEHGLTPHVGDLVDVLATFDPQTLGDDGDPTVVIAPAVPVLAAEAPPDAGDTVAVTVVVTPRQASRLAFSAAAGTLSLALAPPEAAESHGRGVR